MGTAKAMEPNTATAAQSGGYSQDASNKTTSARPKPINIPGALTRSEHARAPKTIKDNKPTDPNL